MFDRARFHGDKRLFRRGRRAILSRVAVVQRGDLLDDELCRLNTPKFINIDPKRELHDAAIGGPGLIKRDGVYDIATLRRMHTQFEMFLSDRALFDDRKVTTPHRFGKARPPGTRVAPIGRASCRERV